MPMRRMGLVELAGRSRQAVTTWLERQVLDRPRLGSRPYFPAFIGRFFTAEEEHANLVTGRFFAGGDDASVVGLLPAIAVARLIYQADRICDGVFDLMGHEGLRFGAPIDWHLDPTTGKRAPLVHWSRLDPLHPVPGGDCKVVWELNRHQWMVRVGQAYRVSGNERYADAVENHLNHWVRSNPRGFGINWSSSLEVGFRLISWCWLLFLLAGSRAMTRGLQSLLHMGIAAHANHIERHLSRYFSPNTHLTGEALALFYAGTLLPGTRSSVRWRSLGARILDEEIGKQVLADGAHFERSIWYHLYTLEIYLHYVLLGERNALPASDEVKQGLARMAEYLLAMRRPDGSLPRLGDDDGGRLLPLSSDRSGISSGAFAAAAAVLDKPELAGHPDDSAEEATWLVGAEGMTQLTARRPPRRKSAAVRLFPQGGYAVMAGGSPGQGHQLIFDVGALGCPISGGHGHADLLGFDCSVFGRPYIVDPGTYCYTANPRWRDHFRSSFAHNTIIVDGEPQARPSGPFSWQERPAARLLGHTRGPRFHLVHAEHSAYTRLPDPVVHSRRIAFVDRRLWVIVDDLTGDGSHTVEARLQVAPGLRVRPGGAPWLAVRGETPRGLLIALFASHPVKARTLEGRVDPIQGWVSPDFGTVRAAPQLCWLTQGPLPIRMVTLLVPVRDVREALRVAVRVSRSAPIAEVELGTGHRIDIDAQAIAVSKGF